MMKLYAPFIREATLRVTMTLRSEGHGGDPSPKLQGAELRALGVKIKYNAVLKHTRLHSQNFKKGHCGFAFTTERK